MDLVLVTYPYVGTLACPRLKYRLSGERQKKITTCTNPHALPTPEPWTVLAAYVSYACPDWLIGGKRSTAKHWCFSVQALRVVSSVAYCPGHIGCMHVTSATSQEDCLLSSQLDRAAINLPPYIPSTHINESKWLGTISRHMDKMPLAVPWMGPADQMVVKKRGKGGDINS